MCFQERTGNNSFNHSALTLQYKLDNEFELVFVVAYQRILQLSYVDKFLNDVHLEFRDKYKNDLQGGSFIMDFDFRSSFDKVLKGCEIWGKLYLSLYCKESNFTSRKHSHMLYQFMEGKGFMQNTKLLSKFA